MEIALTVEGPDGYRLDGGSSMAKISRDPADLAAQMIGANHGYPDGAVLFLGTLFAPVEDRGAPGAGLHPPDRRRRDGVGAGARRARNRMRLCADCAPWTYGASHLMRHLAARGLL